MKKVKIISDVSDRSGVHKAGDEIEVEDAVAEEYVKAGLVEEVSGASHTPTPPTPRPHTPVSPKAPETH
jgi:hypothetical protein